MSKPDGIPDDLWRYAGSVVGPPDMYISRNVLQLVKARVALSLVSERQRCVEIIEAEMEWGFDAQDAQRMIEDGSEPRYISGWSAYDASKETGE